MAMARAIAMAVVMPMALAIAKGYELMVAPLFKNAFRLNFLGSGYVNDVSLTMETDGLPSS